MFKVYKGTRVLGSLHERNMSEWTVHILWLPDDEDSVHFAGFAN